MTLLSVVNSLSSGREFIHETIYYLKIKIFDLSGSSQAGGLHSKPSHTVPGSEFKI
jgi:hypothetical protein